MKTVSIADAKIIFRNFSGRPDKFNPNGGERGFSVILDRDLADELAEEGWNIKQLKPRDENEEPKSFLSVKLNYGDYPPNIWLISRKKTLLNEDTIASLDYAEIDKVDLVLNPYQWTVSGRSGIAAYVKNMYVTIVEDEFAGKYDDYE